MAEGQDLVVDNNEDVRLGLRLLLEAKGYRVDATAADIVDAQRRL